jgi:hypothetical protein
LYIFIETKILCILILTGIYNGSKGTVVGFAFCKEEPPVLLPLVKDFHADHTREIPVVFVKMDSTIGGISSNINNIIPFTAVCDESDIYDGYHRWQLPLRAASAITTHKMQGTTAVGNVVTMPSLGGSFTRGLDYVANSRATELSKLFLLRPLTKESFTSFPNSRATIDREYTRLAQTYST